MARAHRKVRASRADFLHRTSTRLVRDHDVIVAEDPAVKNMIRNRSLAKAISDCGWGAFRQMIEYKTARAGRHLIVIERWYPSSKTCSACGHLLAELSLNTRTSLLVSSALESQGVPPSHVHLVAMPFPAMPAALKAHRIDAALLRLTRPR